MPALRVRHITVIGGKGSPLQVIVKDNISELLSFVPTLVNQGMNVTLARIGSAFGRKFTRERLRTGGVRIHRKGTVKGQIPGGPSLPANMRRAGFKGVLEGREQIGGKRMRIRTRNPIMYARQVGATIRAKGGKGEFGLAIPFSKTKNVTPEERKNAVMVRIGGKLLLVTRRQIEGKPSKLIPLVHFQQSVRQKANLGFTQTWDAFLPEAFTRLDKGITAILRRMRGAINDVIRGVKGLDAEGGGGAE